MPRFTLIQGTPAPDTPAEQVRKRVRKTRVKSMPQCPRCASREYIEAKIGNVKNKLCVACLTKGERVVMLD